MTSGFVWTDGSPDELIPDMFDQWVARVEQALLRLAQLYAANIESYMKQNASWEDQTGNLRQSLFAQVRHEIGLIAIELGYGVYYGDFLEYAHQGRFSIIAPTMDYFRPKLMADVKAIVS
jgi:hypothetical protein